MLPFRTLYFQGTKMTKTIMYFEHFPVETKYFQIKIIFYILNIAILSALLDGYFGSQTL